MTGILFSSILYASVFVNSHLSLRYTYVLRPTSHIGPEVTLLPSSEVINY